MPTLAKAASTGLVLWPALLSLGSVVVGGALTFLAQRWGLAYQTRQQREMRRADSQRVALLALRDLLLEVDDAARRARSAQWEALGRTGQWDMETRYHPDVQALKSLTYQLQLRAIEVESKELRGTIDVISRSAWLEATADSEEDAKAQENKLIERQNTAVRLLGEQLRR